MIYYLQEQSLLLNLPPLILSLNFSEAYFHSQSQRNPQELHCGKLDLPPRIQKGKITALHALYNEDLWQAYPRMKTWSEWHSFSFLMVPMTPKHAIALNLNSKDQRTIINITNFSYTKNKKESNYGLQIWNLGNVNWAYGITKYYRFFYVHYCI